MRQDHVNKSNTSFRVWPLIALAVNWGVFAYAYSWLPAIHLPILYGIIIVAFPIYVTLLSWAWARIAAVKTFKEIIASIMVINITLIFPLIGIGGEKYMNSDLAMIGFLSLVIWITVILFVAKYMKLQFITICLLSLMLALYGGFTRVGPAVIAGILGFKNMNLISVNTCSNPRFALLDQLVLNGVKLDKTWVTRILGAPQNSNRHTPGESTIWFYYWKYYSPTGVVSFDENGKLRHIGYGDG